MDIHFAKLKQKFLVTFPHHTNSLRRITFIIKFYYFHALFLRQRHFENIRFNYDVILNVMDIEFFPNLISCSKMYYVLFTLTLTFVLSVCPFDISAGIRAFVIGLSQISSFFS